MPGQATAGNPVSDANDRRLCHRGNVASKHDLAQQRAAAVMRWGDVPLSRIVHYAKEVISDASLNRLSHQDRGQKDRRPVDPVRRKRAARCVGHPQPVARKPLHLRADVVTSCRRASPRGRSRQAGRSSRSPIFYRQGRLVHRAVTTAGARIGPWLTSLWLSRSSYSSLRCSA
jgi:hypothetical protein